MEDQSWFDIAHGDKSLHIASWDIDAVMFEGFQGNLNISSDGVDGVSDEDFGREDSGVSEGFKGEAPIIVLFQGFREDIRVFSGAW